jgi:hypothetical protein
MELFTAFRTGLISRREDLRRVGALVDPVRLLDAIVAAFDEVSRAETAPLLDLTQAARECGYSPDALGRMVRAGRIPNLGRPGAPKVRRSDLPRKPGWPDIHPGQPAPSRALIARAQLDTRPDPDQRLA